MAFQTRICGLKIGGSNPPLVMGVLNLSPESFYKKSVQDRDSLLSAAQKMVDDGAALLDVGARSTAPNSPSITTEEEKNRLLFALDILADNISVPISVDTMYAEIAEEALHRGASIVNDISGLKNDPDMAGVIGDFDACAILMAAQKKPGDPLGMNAVLSALSNSISMAECSGIDSQKIILDPGIGHWIPEKTSDYDFDLIQHFERLLVFEKPILIAVSRKSFLGDATQKPPEGRLISGVVAASIAAYKGGHIIRTHDVSETVDAVKIVHSILTRKPNTKTV
ncbi:dihydropteroate synthase [Methanolapillus millepedarum]|uniref:dihydropteroate synthase n=1 Tax=Methanolapillus millepedarum TaxID=3028296 RepID=A0AA96V5N4_9EURY|nr:Dihydropteroate synthase [Methanosarcinaceae archaeon Ac7]